MALTTSQHDETVAPLPTWARPPAADPAPSTRRGVLTRAATAAVVAAAMAAFGHRNAAMALVAVFTVVSVVSWRVPVVARGIERFLHRFQHLVGRVLTVVLLTAVYAVAFVPAALVLRLLRRDPLALGSRAGDASFWRPAARPKRPLHRHSYTDERHPRATGGAVRRRPLRTALAVLGALVLLATIDLGAGLAMGPDPQAEVDEPARQVDDAAMEVPDVAARTGEPWAPALYAELSAAYERSEYHPFRGWTVPDFRGTHVNVEDEVRRSYQTSLPGPAVEVFFFGGSTMMGWFQRDEHTIPSEVVRLAEADGIAVEAVNYGQPAYQNWQEVMLLQELVSGGAVPDVAVFYDGVNELASQFRSGPSEDPIHLQSRTIGERLAGAAAAAVDDEEPAPASERLVDAYLEISALGRAYRASPVKDLAERVTGTADTEHPWPDQQERPQERGRAASSLHGRGVALGDALSSGYDFETRWFWQPFIYTKDAAPGEEDVVGSWGTDPASWTVASDEARDRLAEPVADLSDALDGVEQPVFYDFVHTNEAGARAVARAMYERLKPTLLELQAGAAP